MELNVFDDDRSRAQVGIGTLIVFIAMVLVAAIAAGVLINTAGFLQTQAEDTGTSSTEQVADNLNVITEVGEVGGANASNITEVRLGVQPAAGADDINLADLSIQYVSDDGFRNLVSPAAGDDDPSADGTLEAGLYAENGSVDGYLYDNTGSLVDNVYEDDVIAAYGVDVITAENPGDVVMTDSADRYELILNTTGTDYEIGPSGNTLNVSEIGPLGEGTSVEVTITTAVGSQTVAFLQVPDSLSGEDDGTTVNL
jgi:flagellin FlaB